jgi:hypothetical protein
VGGIFMGFCCLGKKWLPFLILFTLCTANIFAANWLGQSTNSEFAAGTQQNCAVTQSGEVTLPMVEVFRDDFSGDFKKWKQQYNHFAIIDGEMTKRRNKMDGSMVWIDNGTWRDVVLEAKIKFTEYNPEGAGWGGFYFRARFKGEYYYNGKVQLTFYKSGSLGCTSGTDSLTSVEGGFVEGQWYQVKVVLKGNILSLWIDGLSKGHVTLDANNTEVMQSGTIGYYGYNRNVFIDDVVVHSGYPTAATYESPVLDASAIASWDNLVWGGSVPANTSISVKTRSGNTTVPDASWSNWQDLTQPAEQEVLLSEDFSGTMPAGWTQPYDNWHVVNGALYQDRTRNGDFIRAGAESWTDLTFEARFMPISQTTVPQHFGFLLRNLYIYTNMNRLYVSISGNSSWDRVDITPLEFNTWYGIKIALVERRLYVYLDGKLVWQGDVPTECLDSGNVGFMTVGYHMVADDVVVTTGHKQEAKLTSPNNQYLQYQITFTSDGQDKPTVEWVALSYSDALVVSHNSLDFGTMRKGEEKTLTVSVDKTGEENWAGIKYSLSNLTSATGIIVPACFTITPEVIEALATGQPVQSQVKLSISTEQAIGQYTGTLTYYFDESGNGVCDSHEKTFVLPITVNVITNLIADIAKIDFGTVAPGNVTETKTIVLKNVGSSPLANISFEGIALKAGAQVIPWENTVLMPDAFQQIGSGVEEEITLQLQIPAQQAPGTYHGYLIANQGTEQALSIELSVVILATPQLVFPLNSVPTSNEVAFKWNPIPGVASYTLRYSQDPSFSEESTVSVKVDSTEYTVSSTAEGTWYWAVAACDPLGEAMEFSETAQFEYIVADETALNLNRVYIYPQRFSPKAGQLTIAYVLSSEAANDPMVGCEVKIFNSGGQLVRTLLPKTQQPAGAHQLYWDGQDDHGNKLPNGPYIIYFFAESSSQAAGIVDKKFVFLFQ